MQLHELKRNTPQRGSKRIGRGRASGKGKTAGRGTKGQKARAGHKIWPNVREQLKKIPKMRGRGIHGLRSIAPKPAVLNVAALEVFFKAGDTVTPAVLRERRIVRMPASKQVQIKILGDGELTKKLIISGMNVSAGAKQKIEKAGGSVAA